MNNNEITKKIYEALENESFKWRTPKGVAEEAGVPEEQVLRVIATDNGNIVQSSVPSTDGSPLFTTREHFYKKSSSFDKLVGAFKGRIR